MIRRFKLFLNPVEDQERWLNNMSRQGYRLSHVGNTFYYFEKGDPGQYQYAVQYVANKSLPELQDYERFLEESKIRWIEKAGSVGKFSLGNLRWRPYADSGARIASSGDMIQKEFLILERKSEETPFQVYTAVEDQIEAMKVRRKPYVMWMVLLTFALILSHRPISFFSWRGLGWQGSGRIGIGLMLIWVLWSLSKFRKSIRSLEKEEIQE